VIARAHRAWGVSNFDVDDLGRIEQPGPDGKHCVGNQVYYSASKRGIEFDLLPAQRVHRMATMAYCPIDQGALASDTTFAEIGAATASALPRPPSRGCCGSRT
jgi:diketogulonate reductase-like aldo/keto reductase